MHSVCLFLKIENHKLHHRHISLLIFSMLVIEMSWIVYNFRDATSNWIGMEYSAMMYVMPQMIIIFFPLTIAGIASRLCDIEHRGNNFKLLYTLEPKRFVYIVKILKGLQYILLLTLPQLAIILIYGKIKNYVQLLPLTETLFFSLEIFIISTCIFFMQLLLSMLFENQMIAFIIGLIGSFSGLFSLFVPQISSYTIWGYYSILAPVSFWWNQDTKEYHVISTDCNWTGLIIFACISIILLVIGKCVLERKEV